MTGPPQWDVVSQARPDEWDHTPLAQWAENANQIDAATDDIDQRQPPEQETQQWDQAHPIWQDTPLAQWATEQATWDGIDLIPPEDEPVFIYD